jgi:Mrp family chromosome partitioning ATPase
MQAVMGLLKQSAELVIFDSPPLQAVTDSAILSSFVDGTLLVVDAKRSRRRVVRMARESLARAGATVLGVVLNRVPVKGSIDYSGYYGESTKGPAGPTLAPAGPADGSGPSATMSGPS